MTDFLLKQGWPLSKILFPCRGGGRRKGYHNKGLSNDNRKNIEKGERMMLKDVRQWRNGERDWGLGGGGKTGPKSKRDEGFLEATVVLRDGTDRHRRGCGAGHWPFGRLGLPQLSILNNGRVGSLFHRLVIPKLNLGHAAKYVTIGAEVGCGEMAPCWTPPDANEDRAPLCLIVV